jgi:iron complex outermembrane receptor protein
MQDKRSRLVKPTRLHRSISTALYGCAFVAAPVGLAVAQDGTDEATSLDRIEVTGSRIKRVDIEGPTPITVISREDLQLSGDLSVADALRSATFNTFGSFQQSSGSSAQSQATVSLRGLGSQYTLLLLDGRRIAGSPVLGAASQNLNAIPFAAVERIEILRDGASAIYGSDAIGGVVNIILRKDYEGLEISGSVERPTRGEPNANSASITGGVTGDRGNMTFVVDHQERDIFFNADRATGIPGLDPGVGLSAYGYPATAYVYDSADGSFDNPLTAAPGDATFVGLQADPRCPTALGSDPLFPNSVILNNPYGTVCYFNFSAVAANEASLRRDSVMVNGNFDISDNVSAFSRVTVTSSESFGRYAATPITNPLPTVAGDNPNNVYGRDIRLLMRFVPGGNRDNTARDRMFDVLFGLQGQADWFGGADWEVAAHHNRYDVDNVGQGFLLRSALQPLIDSGAYNPFGDPNDPANIAAVASARHTTLQTSETRFAGLDGQVNFDLFEIANGPVGFAAGFDYRDERFSDNVDAQSAAGNVAGTSGGNAQGERAAYAVFAEAVFPLLPTLNLDIAARYDHYNDFGNSTNPKVSLEFRPFDSLLVRGSWGTGFRAPSLANLYQSPQQSFNGAIDTRACAGNVPGYNAPFDPCNSRQYENVSGGNENLSPEESESWGVGVVVSPLDRLTLSLDYYNIELEDQIGTLTLQDILNLENSNGGSPNVIRNPNTGAITLINASVQNIAGVKTDGVDFEAEYSFDSAVGTFTQGLTVSYVGSFEQDEGLGEFIEQLDEAFVPDMRAQLALGWSSGDFSATVIGNLIGSSEEKTTRNQALGTRIPSWTTWDLQGTWATPWNGKVTVGVRNIGDRDPPLDNTILSGPFYVNSQYDWYGRVPYVRYEQKF